MDVTITVADIQHVPRICQICAEGGRHTHAGNPSEEEIEAAVKKYCTPQRVAQEVESPEHWDGWLVALDDGKVVGAGGGGITEPGVGEEYGGRRFS